MSVSSVWCHSPNINNRYCYFSNQNILNILALTIIFMAADYVNVGVFESVTSHEGW